MGRSGMSSPASSSLVNARLMAQTGAHLTTLPRPRRNGFTGCLCREGERMKAIYFQSLRRSAAATLAMLMVWTGIGTPRLQAMMVPAETAVTASAQDRQADLQTIRTALENKVVRQ